MKTGYTIVGIFKNALRRESTQYDLNLALQCLDDYCDDGAERVYIINDYDGTVITDIIRE